MCPVPGRLLGARGLRARGHLVCHCLLIETDDCLALVDTGFGLDDVARPSRRLGPVRHLLAPVLSPDETAARQVEALGFAIDDVRHIVLTHLDLDHAGGLSDFPSAEVHVLAAEKDAADHPRTVLEKERYHAVQWAHGPTWQTYEPTGEPWRGFRAVRQLRGLPPEILMVPLAGHSRGHAAIAVQTPEGWLLHCGDAYFHRGEMERPPRCPVGLRVFQSIVEVDRSERLSNQARLRALAARDPAVRVFCAHDPVELGRLKA